MKSTSAKPTKSKTPAQKTRDKSTKSQAKRDHFRQMASFEAEMRQLLAQSYT